MSDAIPPRRKRRMRANAECQRAYMSKRKVQSVRKTSMSGALRDDDRIARRTACVPRCRCSRNRSRWWFRRLRNWQRAAPRVSGFAPTGYLPQRKVISAERRRVASSRVRFPRDTLARVKGRSLTCKITRRFDVAVIIFSAHGEYTERKNAPPSPPSPLPTPRERKIAPEFEAEIALEPCSPANR